eukprot:Nitzschia sp. Nitz4//scaffold83_size84149//8332//9255//NITZ4_005163-RA/size84149-processed-gene-0.50-mRNA-1//-1//CDS//3329558914//8068//frame0
MYGLPLGFVAILFITALNNALVVLGAVPEHDIVQQPKISHHELDDGLLLYEFDSIASTQDEARRIAEEESLDSIKTFTVTTIEQTKGRGTNGRVWMGNRGNTFVTIGVRLEDWLNLPSKTPLTLLPLKIGSIVASNVEKQLIKNCQDNTSIPTVSVKWPNDVLVDGRKISGVLIESSSNGWFLVGIGINYSHAPQVPDSGPNRGRPSISIHDVCPQVTVQERQALQLGIDLSYDLHIFLHGQERSTQSKEQILGDWKHWVDWDTELTMRDTKDNERVRLIDVLPDGRVQVENKGDGSTRTLVSDYFL